MADNANTADDPKIEQWGDGRTPVETGDVGAPDFTPEAYQPYGEDDKPPTEAETVAETLAPKGAANDGDKTANRNRPKNAIES